jgi:hydrogenase maturation protease
MKLPLLPGQRLLIFGIGNPGRQDDGLGVRFVERLEQLALPSHVTLEANYQLCPEDALVLAANDVVLFVDTTVAPDAPDPYGLSPLAPATEISFSTHALSMGSLLALCTRLYDRSPVAFALALPGYSFEVNADLSERAEENLNRALADVRELLTGAAQENDAPSLRQ